MTTASYGCSVWPESARSIVWVVATPRSRPRPASREGTVDEGAVYDDIYVVEAVHDCLPGVTAGVTREVDLGQLPEDGQRQVRGDDPVRLVHDLGDLEVYHEARQHVRLDGLEPVGRAYVLDHRPQRVFRGLHEILVHAHRGVPASILDQWCQRAWGLELGSGDAAALDQVEAQRSVYG